MKRTTSEGAGNVYVIDAAEIDLPGFRLSIDDRERLFAPDLERRPCR